MKRRCTILAVAALFAVTQGVALAESWSENFEDSGEYPNGVRLDAYPLIWGGGVGIQIPEVNDNYGRNFSRGLGEAQRNFHWVAHPFEWKDPTVGGVITQIDLQTPGIGDQYFPWRQDSTGWTIDGSSLDSADFFQVTMERRQEMVAPYHRYGQILTKWRNADSGTMKESLILEYDADVLLEQLSWYRLRAEFTKLTNSSAQVDVSLSGWDTNGDPVEIASGTIPDTSLLGIYAPHPDLFAPSVMYPTYKTYDNGAGAKADNVYFEIIRVTPQCASSVSPDEFTPQIVEADKGQPATPSAIPYVISNLGTSAFTYDVVELDETQSPADVGWLSVDKTNGSVDPSNTDTVTASINTAGLSHGVYTAYLKFTDSCGTPHVREIVLKVYSCHWTGPCSVERAYSTAYPTLLPEDVVYRITNSGDAPSNYSVVKTGGSSCSNYNWLIITNPTGTVPVGGYVDVVCTIDPSALTGRASGTTYDCTLELNDDCSPVPETRNVHFLYVTEEDSHVWTYNGDVDPETDDSAGLGLRFSPDPISVPNGYVDDDPDAVDGKVWRMQDLGNPPAIKAWYRAESWDPIAWQWDEVRVNGEAGSTMVARVKVNLPFDKDRVRAILGISDNDASSAEFYWGGADGEAAECKRNVIYDTGVGTSDFVILWITSKGSEPADEWRCDRDVDLYIVDLDGTVLWHEQITDADAEGSTYRGFYFGDSAGLLGMDVSFDWVTGTNLGAFAPGEEEAVLGRSLIISEPTCDQPFPDSNSDGFVDMVDFAFLQRCYSPTVEVAEACLCFDRTHDDYIDENDVELFLPCALGPNVPFDESNPPTNCNP